MDVFAGWCCCNKMHRRGDVRLRHCLTVLQVSHLRELDCGSQKAGISLLACLCSPLGLGHPHPSDALWLSSAPVVAGLKAPFPYWLPARNQSQFLDVTYTPCHVAYSIFRSSSREFLSHQIPVTLLKNVFLFLSQFESLSLGRAQLTLRPYLIRLSPPQIVS